MIKIRVGESVLKIISLIMNLLEGIESEETMGEIVELLLKGEFGYFESEITVMFTEGVRFFTIRTVTGKIMRVGLNRTW